jgi:AmmeMemoRadiSam system protein A
MLNPDARQALLSVARASVEAAVRGAEPDAQPPENPALHRPGAAFVTVRVGGELRGCIGHVIAEQPLWISVLEMAAAAATRDERFAPVSPSELAGVTIEISVLTPRRKLEGAERLVIGRDGLYVRRDSNTGLLLPQVAAEHGWSAEEFLAQTCRKAGLPPEAWKDPATSVEFFSADVFGSAKNDVV